MPLNKLFLEKDGLVVGTNQLVTSGDGVSIGRNLVVQGTTNTSNTITTNLSVSGITNLNAITKTANVIRTALGGTNTIFLADNSDTYYITPVISNFNFNFTYSRTQTLNSVMANGSSLTTTIAVAQGSTTFVLSNVFVDNTPVLINWFGGALPTGNSNGIEYYNFTIIKTENNVFSVLVKLDRFSPAFIVGQQSFTTPGTFTWTAPAGVTSVSVVAVGGGGGGGNQWSFGGGSGGGLGWRNNISVVPGQSYTVVVGAGGSVSSAPTLGETSFFINTSTVAGFGAGRGGTGSNGASLGFGGGYTGDGGGRGGDAGTQWSAAGAGAGGYTGAGGDSLFGGSNGAGGGGGSGTAFSSTFGTGAGGGVGILGQGANGLSGTSRVGQGYGGGGGSGGANGLNGEPASAGSNAIAGGAFGGGGGGSGTSWGGGPGGGGAVRIIWSTNPGLARAFPSTNTGNL